MSWKKSSTRIAAVLAALLIVVLFVLFISQNDNTPPIVALPDPVGNTDLSPTEGLNTEILVDINRDTIQSVLSVLSRVDSYHRELTSTLYSSSGKLVRELEMWQQGRDIRIISKTGSDTQNVLIDGDNLYIWYGGAAGLYSGLADSGSADEFSSIISYEDIISLPPENIIDAGHTDFASESCIFVEYTQGELGYTYSAYISIATGLLMCDEVRDGNTLIYSMVSKEPDLSPPSDSIFRLPPELQ